MLWKQPDGLAVVRRDDLGIGVEEIVTGSYLDELSNLWELAALSNNVYENNEEIISTEWDKLDDSFACASKGKWYQSNIIGLKVSVYTKELNGVQIAVIAYRGTSSLIDFYSNLDWVTRYNPFVRNLYSQVRDQVKITVKKLKKSYGEDLTIISTGHSLGGGLAQQAAYSVDSIKRVYAFDPSPVTGFSLVPKKDRSRNKKGVRIFRIFEHGEVLAYLRLLMKASYSIKGQPNNDPEVIEIRLNFDNKGNGINQHSMYALATNLKKVHKQCLNK